MSNGQKNVPVTQSVRMDAAAHPETILATATVRPCPLPMSSVWTIGERFRKSAAIVAQMTHTCALPNVTDIKTALMIAFNASQFASTIVPAIPNVPKDVRALDGAKILRHQLSTSV